MLPPPPLRFIQMTRHAYLRDYFLLLLSAILPCRTDAVWTLTIPPYDEECFLIKTPSTMKSMKMLVGDYEMIDEGGQGLSSEPLLVYVMEARKHDKIVWRSPPLAAYGSFRVPISPGNTGYWICLQNTKHGPDNREEEPEHPDHRARVIGFSYRLERFDEKPAPLVFTEHTQYEWMEKSRAVEDELRVLVHHHDYMRIREADHRSVVEQTFESTLRWTLAEAAMVFLVAAGQVVYFRRFLERKSFL
jgi:emp24/gp25L/p24 family/GOLD